MGDSEGEGELESGIDVLDFFPAEDRDTGIEQFFPDRGDHIRIDHALFGQAVFFTERDFDGDSSYRRPHFGHRDGVPDGIGFVSGEKNDRTPACRER